MTAPDPIPRPTETELEILQILWQHGPSTVRFVNELQNEKKEVGYTTTLKIMQIMAEKNILAVDKSTRTHVFRPLLEEEKTQQHLLSKFLDLTFRGSALKLVMQALGQSSTTDEELQEIRRFLDEKKGKEK